MSQFQRERSLQHRVERVLASALPEVDVLDLEFDAARSTVRIYVDAPGGVTHELCARVTTSVRDLCPDHALEVSSPGDRRPLRRVEHFQAARGRRVRIRRRGGRRPFTATVVDARGGTLIVRRADSVEEELPLHDVVRSHLVTESGTDGRPSPSHALQRRRA